MQAQDDSPATLRAVALPLAASFVLTGWAMVLVCRFQLGSTLSGRALLLFPLCCLLITAAIHSATVFLAQRLLDNPDSPAAWPLIYGTWLPIAWVPLLLVLATHSSPWTAALLPAIGAMTAAILLRFTRNGDLRRFEGGLQSLLHVPARATRDQTIQSPLLAAAGVQLGILMAVTHHELIAGLLLTVAAILPVIRLRQPEQKAPRTRSTVRGSLAAVALTIVALLPFLKDGPGHAALQRLLEMQRMKTAIAASRAPAAGTGYSGIILLPPPRPRATILPPVPTSDPSSTRAKPVLIPFNGSYWYFKEPDDRPRRDARVVHGDPTKAQIRSTTRLPLLMEAHQPVLPALSLGCCSAIEVNLTNADIRPGLIALELVLRDPETKAVALSLGTVVIPSTTAADIPLDRQSVSETLAFRIPRSARNRRCTEISLRVKPATSRSLAASQISIDSFRLVP